MKVGDYLLRARLGEGGMGVVHLAQKPGEHPVALKVLRPHIVGGQEARERLAREVNALSKVRSPWVAEIVDADPWGEIPFVATRYVPGLSLDDHVREDGAVAGSDLHLLAAGLAEAVAAVHAAGVVHRDIKPSNVVMEGRTPILIDFGLARLADDPRLTMTGWLLGTPGYLAPEILLGQDATPASDVHAWAATVAFAALGRPPFGTGPTLAVTDRIRRGEHDLAGLDPQVHELIVRALSPVPTDRPTLDEIRDWLGTGADAAAWTAPITVRDDVEDERTWLLPSDTALVPAETAFDASEATLYSDEEGWPPPAGVWERMRRSSMAAACGSVVVGGFTLAPYLTILLSALLVWLLRSGSLATSAHRWRLRRRGAKWYDAAQVLAAAPWHLVAAIPGATVLMCWSLGMALAAGLVCFALALSMAPTLGWMGLAFALSLWWGPGSARLRWPIRRVLDPIAGQGVSWLFASILLAALGSGLIAAALATGTNWAPGGGAPLSGVDLPAWL